MRLGTKETTRRTLRPDQCEVLWHRILEKKYSYGFSRDWLFVQRCQAMQDRLNRIARLWRFSAMGIEVDDPLEGDVIFNRLLIQPGNRNGSTEHA